MSSGRARRRAAAIAVLVIGTIALATGSPVAAVPATPSPFLVPFPRARLRTRHRRLVARELIARPLALAADETRRLTFTLPARAVGNPDAFVTVTARLRTAARQERLVRIGAGGDQCVSAPVAPDPGWQAVTTVFAFPITTRELTVDLVAAAPVEIASVRGLTTFDDRYVREVCTKASVLINGRREARYDYHERVAYRKTRQRRIVIVGNSTIDGCGARRGATFPFLLQQQFDALEPGRNEVINAGIGGATLLGHVISITNHYPLHEWQWPQLSEMPDLQRQQPAIRDLDPDVVILAAHWNDMTDFRQFLGFGRITSPPTEPASSAGATPTTYADQALAALFAYLDSGTPGALESAQAFQREMLAQPMSPAFDPEIAREHVRFLTLAYAHRLARYAPKARLVLLTLPSWDTYPGTDPAEATLQRQADVEVAAELGLPLIDLAQAFDREFPARSAARRAAVADMFTDPIHFSYRGNEWLADETGAALRALLRTGALR